MAASRETVFHLLYPQPDVPLSRASSHAARQVYRVRAALDTAYEAGKADASSDRVEVREFDKNKVLLLLLGTGRQAVPGGVAEVIKGGALRVIEDAEDFGTVYAPGSWVFYTYVTAEQYALMEKEREAKS